MIFVCQKFAKSDKKHILTPYVTTNFTGGTKVYPGRAVRSLLYHIRENHMAKLFAKFVSQKDDEVEIEEVETTDTEGVVDEDAVAGDDEWIGEGAEEGQLSVDVYQTEDTIVIKSTIAGVSPENIDIAITNDMVTIRGERHLEEELSDDQYFYQECYWGGFSRSIILPMEVKSDEADAALKNGVLTIKLPKAKKSKSVSVKVKTD